ncbi:MAG: HesB/IscA family protein [Microcoleaceae cyanobacterium]
MIQVSDAAANEIFRLHNRQVGTQQGNQRQGHQRQDQRQSDNSMVCLRLGVEPGGCCQWFYTLELGQPQPGEAQMQWGSIQIIADPEKLALIDGLVLDYSEDLMGGGFRFNNPNATQTCGCSSSFAVDQ